MSPKSAAIAPVQSNPVLKLPDAPPDKPEVNSVEAMVPPSAETASTVEPMWFVLGLGGAYSKELQAKVEQALASLPKGSVVGFELMDTQKLGISQFAEQLNYQRGLEGELARSVQSLAAVKAARVHLAIPKPSVFMREELKPSASVMLRKSPAMAMPALFIRMSMAPK